MFSSKLFGQKAETIVTACVENTVINSVLEQVVCQEGLNQCYYMARKHCKLQFTVFSSKLFGQKAETIVTACVENTVINSVLEQVVCQEGLNQCYYMGRKHCNL